MTIYFFPEQEFIQRWAVPENITSGLIGEPGEGTTIDLDEPFLLRWPDLYNPVSVSSLFSIYIPRIGCDADGWMVLPNKEPSYAHFFHVFSHTEIRNILVTGDAEIGYIGFGEKGERNLQSCFCRTFCHGRNRFISQPLILGKMNTPLVISNKVQSNYAY